MSHHVPLLWVRLLVAAFAIVRKTDQIVVGMAVNLLALGATGLAARALYGGATPSGPTAPVFPIPGLSELPFLGAVLFHQTPFLYGSLLVAALVGFGLARTRPGLRLRAVGEVTLAVLAFAAARVRAPGDLGRAYHRERGR